MWTQKSHAEKKGAPDRGLVAVAIDKDKGSQNALKWATENLLSRGKTVVLVHINPVDSHHHHHHHYHSDANNGQTSPHRQNLEKISRELFMSFHCYCTRKDIHCFDVILEDADVVRAITEYVSSSGIENLVLGATSRHGFIRFKTSSVSTSVSKGAPDFCTVYIISKGKVASVRQASRPAPYTSPLLEQIIHLNKEHTDSSDMQSVNSSKAERVPVKVHSTHHDDSIKSPVGWGTRYPNGVPWGGDTSESETDRSYLSSGRPSTDRSPSSYLYEAVDDVVHPMANSASTGGYASPHWESKFTDHHSTSLHEFSTFSHDSNGTSGSHSPRHMSGGNNDVEAEMRRLKLELKQTMDMYSTACKEALTAKQKAMELHHWKLDEERKLEEARLAQEAALLIAEKERAKCRAAIEQAEKAKKIAELEAQRRVNMEMRAQKEAGEMRKNMGGGGMQMEDARCRKYTIEEIKIATDHFSQARKIGEGGYGPVFKSYLDHTAVAIKVLRPDAAQGRSQFRREVEVLSCIRHPNMVLLLGACPEYGCLVYEYMANGSLEDRLFRRGNTPPINWHHRFRIAAEIATGLLFLHQTKPEPIVHRDLKPGNVLLDHNFVSKISDVGLARLVPAVAENVTQCRMTATAGTFCYIDPEYQQTGMLGVKSDLYSLGIVLLQLLTAKPPMGITHMIEDSIAKNYFADVLDPAVPDWPEDEALCLAMIGIQCAEMRRKDRPDLGKVVLPELLRLRELADQKSGMWHCGSHVYQDVMNDQTSGYSGSSETQTEASSALTTES